VTIVTAWRRRFWAFFEESGLLFLLEEKEVEVEELSAIYVLPRLLPWGR
jgi:hypothetical protein